MCRKAWKEFTLIVEFITTKYEGSIVGLDHAIANNMIVSYYKIHIIIVLENDNFYF